MKGFRKNGINDLPRFSGAGCNNGETEARSVRAEAALRMTILVGSSRQPSARQAACRLFSGDGGRYEGKGLRQWQLPMLPH
jgi:hypothetical protein